MSDLTVKDQDGVRLLVTNRSAPTIAVKGTGLLPRLTVTNKSQSTVKAATTNLDGIRLAVSYSGAPKIIVTVPAYTGPRIQVSVRGIQGINGIDAVEANAIVAAVTVQLNELENDFQDHLEDLDNPHEVTALQVGADPEGSAAAAQAAAAIDATAKAAAAQAFAIQRVNHTGVQAQATITGLVADLALKADLVGGVVPTAQIPAIAITEYLGSSANQAAMLAKVGQQGDWTIRTDVGTVWVITGNDPSLLADWTEMSYPVSAVTSVNGQVGVVVLGKADVGLGNADNTSDANKPVSTAQALADSAVLSAASADATAKANAKVQDAIVNGEIAKAPSQNAVFDALALKTDLTTFNTHEGAGGAVHADVVAGGDSGFMTGADKTKLDGVATGATAYTDELARDALAAAFAAGSHTNFTVTYNDALDKFDFAASGGGGGGGSGEAVAFDVAQVAHGLVIGNSAYFDGADWLPADSSADASYADGIVSAVADADNFTVTRVGIVTATTGQWDAVSGFTGGLPVGEHLWQSSVAGEITDTQPTPKAQYLGKALSSTVLLAHVGEVIESGGTGGGGGGVPAHDEYTSTTPISTSASFPIDTSIPQVGEGADTGASITLVIADAASKIRIRCSIGYVSSPTSNHAGFYFFRDGAGDTVGGSLKYLGPGLGDAITFEIIIPAGAAGSTTFSLRWGVQAGTAATMYALSLAGTNYHGAGNMICISAEEILP